MSSKEHQEKELAILRLEQQLSGIRSTLQSTEKDKLTLMGALRHAEECDPAPPTTPTIHPFPVLACVPCLHPLLTPLACAPVAAVAAWMYVWILRRQCHLTRAHAC